MCRTAPKGVDFILTQPEENFNSKISAARSYVKRARALSSKIMGVDFSSEIVYNILMLKNSLQFFKVIYIFSEA